MPAKISMKKRKSRAIAAVSALEGLYPDAICSLKYEQPYQLLLATRLAAQCTDARVNIVTAVLFEKYPTMESLSEADLEDVENIVKPCGLYKTKARDLIHICALLIDRYGGVVPDSVEELTKLPGVGRKTANLIVGDVYHKPGAVVCDTHCIRISNRLGLIDSQNPLIAERELRELLPPEKSNDFCHRLVLFGRDICMARGPKCEKCPLRQQCRFYQEQK